MARTVFGSVSVEETRKRLEGKLKRTDALTKARQDANKLLRGTNTDIQPRRVAPPQTRKKKPKKIIKFDPNVKPIAPTLGPVGVITSIADAFKRSRAKAAQVATAGKEKFKAITVASAAKPGDKTIVPLAAKPSRNPLVKNTGDNVKVVPLKGHEQLAKEQGVPEKQTLNQARGVKPGQSGPLPNLLRKRKAARNRKQNLGGDRVATGRSRSRARPSLVAGSGTIGGRDTTKKITVLPKERKGISKKVTFAIGAGIGLAREFRRNR